jgi:hypothetical protein
MGEGRTSGNKVSVYDAATTMGVTVDAIRKRIARGTIPHERDEDGRVWVLLDTDQDTASRVQDTDQPQSTTSTHISEMRARIASLERQIEQANERDRENRRIIAALTSRIPELPAAQEQAQERRESPETAESPGPRERPFTDEEREPQEAAQPRSWWSRIFGK